MARFAPLGPVARQRPTVGASHRFVEINLTPEAHAARQVRRVAAGFNNGAAAHRRPALQSDGLDNLSATVATDRAFLAAAAAWLSRRQALYAKGAKVNIPSLEEYEQRTAESQAVAA